MEVPLKKKYTIADKGRFKGGRANNGGRKKLVRSELALVPKSNIHLPKKAKWAKQSVAGTGTWGPRAARRG